MKPVNEPTQTNGNHRNAWNPERKTLETVNTTKIWMRHLFIHTWPTRRNWQQCSSNMTSNILHRTKRMQTNSCDSTRIKRQLTTGHNTKRNNKKKAHKIKPTEYTKEPRLRTSNNRRSNWRPTKANKQARETKVSVDNRRNRSNLKQPDIKEMHEPTGT